VEGVTVAHFAQVINGRVSEVIVVANSDCGDLPFPESEPVGQAYIASLGIPGFWLQTSYNANFRGAYAGINFVYDVALDEFIALPVEE
jgi:hypothetical protein